MSLQLTFSTSDRFFRKSSFLLWPTGSGAPNSRTYLCPANMQNEDLFKQVVAHAKEYGFVFQSSELYDGLSAVYDYGQNGVELKKNIREYWWRSMVQLHQNIVGLDSAIFMHPRIWKASGHVDGFNDPMIDNKDSKKRYRADVLLEDYQEKNRQKIQKEVEKYFQTQKTMHGTLIILARYISPKQVP